MFYGDGALGFSIAEIDTLVRSKLGVVCVVGNDAGIAPSAPRFANPSTCTHSPSRYDQLIENL